MKTFWVCKVNGNPTDTYADEDPRRAVEIAQMDEGDQYLLYRVQANDAGAARLMKPSGPRLPREYMGDQVGQL